MSYIKTKTFTAATAISAADIQENLDGVRDYLDGSIVPADIAPDGWVESRHIMRGHYNPISNIHDFATGASGGYTSGAEELSWMGNGPTSRNAPTSDITVYLPKTAVTFYLEASADVLFTFYGRPTIPIDLGTGGTAGTPSNAWICLDGAQQNVTKMSVSGDGDVSAIGGAGVGLADFVVNPETWSNFFLGEGLAAGWHTIGLKGNSTNFTFYILHNWGVTIEAFYR